jgi:hypothetical protein
VAAVLAADHRGDAVVDGEAGAADEREQRRDERPDERLLAVPERVLLVGRLAAAAQRDVEEHLGDGVRERVRRLGQHRGRAGDQAGHQLGGGDDEVGQAGHHDGEDALVAAGLGRRRDGLIGVQGCGGGEAHRELVDGFCGGFWWHAGRLPRRGNE